MPENAAPKIVIVGCGNMAWHVARKFVDLKFNVHVYNHRASPALEEMRRKLGVGVSPGLHNIENTASFYFVCVPDRFIAECAKKINPVSPRAVVCHTSGSAALDELGSRAHGTAVFYPLQTFSRKDEVSWQRVPVFIEGDSEQTSEQVMKLALLFSKKVQMCDQEKRLRLHTAAVLVNNFVNALYVSAGSLLGDHEGNFDILLPLAEHTVEKVKNMDPRAAQTGPAKRGDKKTIRRHLRLLEDRPALKKLYRQMTALIGEQQSGSKI